ncbi:MAG: tyrosine-type recombinase/integrase [Planctomycetota bacterium]
MEKLELVESRSKRKTYTVESWCKKYIAMRKKDKKTKSDTIRKLENVSNRLSLFFKDTPLHEVNPLEAKNFRTFLTGAVGHAENTARKHIAISRQFFNAAIESWPISENPFKGQPVTIRANKARFFYIAPEIAQKVLNACPNAEWRLIFGLARFGGLRCPSEVLRLKWQDIDFEKEQFTVHATKTEHHADSGIRTVPMFPELKSLFQDVFDQAKPGTVYCITQYRDKTVNLRTQLTRIIMRADLKPWPKLFQNCRSTRETELFKLTGGNIKAVCEWIGNSPVVAMQHYAQITEADMKQAAKLAVLNDAGKRVHNRVHTTGETPEMSRKESQKK